MNTEMQRRLFAPLVRGLIACLLVYAGLVSAAAITEVEPNDSLSSAQPIPVPPEGVTISAVIGQIGGPYNIDVDFFTFQGTQGDTPSIAIVGALKPDGSGACPPGFPANLVLLDSFGNVAGSASGDCLSAIEARLGQVTLLTTGTYYVGVSAFTHYIDQGGIIENTDVPTPGGDYQLVISGVRDPTPTPTPTPSRTPASSARNVPIEVRHWHQDERDLGKRNGLDPIAVVIFSMADFDAMTVDSNSLTFGATGNEKSLFRCRKEGRDINRDGLMDMVCYFKPDIANFHTGDLNGSLKGKTKSGQQIEGSAALKIFTRRAERHDFKHRDRDDSDRDDQQNGRDRHKK